MIGGRSRLMIRSRGFFIAEALFLQGYDVSSSLSVHDSIKQDHPKTRRLTELYILAFQTPHIVNASWVCVPVRFMKQILDS